MWAISRSVYRHQPDRLAAVSGNLFSPSPAEELTLKNQTATLAFLVSAVH